jgi:hypothetical protein
MQKVITVVIPYLNLGQNGVQEQALLHPELNTILEDGYEVKQISSQTNNTGNNTGYSSITFVLEKLD